MPLATDFMKVQIVIVVLKAEIAGKNLLNVRVNASSDFLVYVFTHKQKLRLTCTDF